MRHAAARPRAARDADPEGRQIGPFDYDRYLVDQLLRPIANLYRVTPLAAGETPAGYNFEILAGDRVIGGVDRKFQLRDRYVLDLSADPDKLLDRRLAIALAIGLDTLQNR